MAHRIILADTQVIFRTGAARVLAMEPEFEILAQCGTLHALCEAIGNFRHSVVLFPTSMTSDIPSLLDEIDHACSRSVVVVEHGVTLRESIAERADGVVMRSVGGTQLVDCLRQVAAGGRSVQSPEPRAVTTDRVGARVLQRLTPKELQIVALVTEGGKNRDIASQLGTKEQVIKNYLRNIYDKAGVSDRLELTIFTQHHRTLADAAQRVRSEMTTAAA